MGWGGWVPPDSLGFSHQGEWRPEETEAGVVLTLLRTFRRGRPSLQLLVSALHLSLSNSNRCWNLLLGPQLIPHKMTPLTGVH